MLFGDIVQNFNSKFMGHHVFGGDRLRPDDLSPVSALRLNFDQLKPETTDEDVDSKHLFGVAMPQFVPQRVISWIGNGASGSESDAEICSTTSGSSSSNNNEPCVSRKVCRSHSVEVVASIETKRRSNLEFSKRVSFTFICRSIMCE